MSRLTPAFGVIAIIAVIVTAGIGALFTEASSIQPMALWQDAYLRHVVWFTFWQALLSTVLSVGLALAVTRALARRQRFRGRAWLVRLLGLPLVIPTIVAVFGIVAIYGQTGLVNRIATGLGFQPSQYLYGLTGILIAHVFFNLPLAIRLLLPTWESVPGESWRLAAQLGMSPRDIFRVIEWPLLRQVLPAVAGLVFMLCFTSFAVVLTLGGGPAATTIEVAIYQALRFDFDLGRAGLLALLQLLLCGLLVGLGQSLGRTHLTQATTGRPQQRPDLGGRGSQVLDYLLIALVAVSTLLPLGAVILAGLTGPLADVLGDAQLWSSALLSLMIALMASALALLGGFALLLGSRELRVNRYRRGAADAIELSGSLILVIPPLVLGAGFFILLRGFTDALAWGPAIVVLVNALMGLPYVIRVLGPPMTRITQQHDRLCASLGIQGWGRLRLIEWPLLRAPIGLALALCAALSTGDLGVIALFGTRDTITLPLLLYQRLGSYQMEAAAVTALVLLGLCLLLFHLIERGIGGGGSARA
jgi:thiamine transport system permease protein